MSDSLGERMGTTQTQDLILLGVLVIGGYLVYELIQGVKATTTALGTAATSLYKGAQTVTAPVATALANAWMAMQPASGMSVLGNVIFPDGSQVPLSQLTVKQDSLGNVYVASPASGLLLQLQPSDANGNYPAVQITDPSQIGTAPADTTSMDFGVNAPASWGS